MLSSFYRIWKRVWEKILAWSKHCSNQTQLESVLSRRISDARGQSSLQKATSDNWEFSAAIILSIYSTDFLVRCRGELEYAFGRVEATQRAVLSCFLQPGPG